MAFLSVLWGFWVALAIPLAFLVCGVVLILKGIAIAVLPWWLARRRVPAAPAAMVAEPGPPAPPAKRAPRRPSVAKKRAG